MNLFTLWTLLVTLNIGQAYTWQQIPPSPRISAQIREILWSPDGTTLVFATSEGVWLADDPTTGEMQLRLLAESFTSVYGISYDTEGAFLAAVNLEEVVVWETTDWTVEQEFTAEASVSFSSIAFNHDSSRIAIGTNQSTIEVYDLTSAQLIIRLEDEYTPICDFACSIPVVKFDQSGRYLASGRQNPTIAQVWDLSNGEVVITVNRSNDVRSVLFTADSRYLITNDQDGIVGWDIMNKTLAFLIDHSSFPVSNIVLDDERGILAAGGITELGAAVVRIWRLQDVLFESYVDTNTQWKLLDNLYANQVVYCLALNPKTGELAFMSVSGPLQIADIESETILATIEWNPEMSDGSTRSTTSPARIPPRLWPISTITPSTAPATAPSRASRSTAEPRTSMMEKDGASSRRLGPLSLNTCWTCSPVSPSC
jgi:WD40 repeat protein